MLVPLHSRLQRGKAASHKTLPHPQDRLGRLFHIDAQSLRLSRRACSLLWARLQRSVSHSDQALPQSDQLCGLQGRMGRRPSQHQTRPYNWRGQLWRGLQGSQNKIDYWQEF